MQDEFAFVAILVAIMAVIVSVIEITITILLDQMKSKNDRPTSTKCDR